MDQTDTKASGTGAQEAGRIAGRKGASALRLRPGGPTWETGGTCSAAPPAMTTGELLVEIECAGLCRTDLQVADGTLPAQSGVVLGHEACGRILARGPGATLALGSRVALDPWIPCGTCGGCRGDSPAPHPRGAEKHARAALRCHGPIRLGIERDGVFAETVSVPQSNAYPVSDSISPERAAYLEPVAAALGVLDAPITGGSRVLVYGANRIAALTARILRAKTAAEIVCLPGDADLPPCEFDVAVETGIQAHTLNRLAQALVPGGTLVLKSRGSSAASFQPGDLVSKSLTLIAPAYGSFAEAAASLADPSFALDDLFGETLPFPEFAHAFDLARQSESTKVFLAPG